MNIYLSIIIPHYNDTSGLEFLLNSISFIKGVEVIVVDDCSNIYHLKRYNELKNIFQYKNIQFLENRSTIKGAGKCRNIGIDKATGECVLFADADDYFVDGWFDIIRKYLIGNYDLIFFNPTSVYKSTHKMSKRHVGYSNLVEKYVKDKNNYTESLLRYSYLVPWSKLIKMDLIKKNNIKFEEVIASNDIMFSVKAGYFAKKIYASSEIIYCVTSGVDTLTTKKSKEIFTARLNEFKKYKIFLASHLVSKEFNFVKWSGFGYVKLSIDRKYGINFAIKVFLKVLLIQIKIIYIRFKKLLKILN